MPYKPPNTPTDQYIDALLKLDGDKNFGNDFFDACGELYLYI